MIQWQFSGDGRFSIQSDTILLRDITPVVNGVSLPGWSAESWRSSPPVLGGGSIEMDMRRTESGLALRLRIRDLPENYVLNSFGIQISAVENLRAYLRNGYHSWDGSFYVQPENLPNSFTDRASLQTGYAVTQILPTGLGANLVLGFDRQDRCQQTFTFATQNHPTALTIQTHWDQKSPGPDGIVSEWLHILESTDVEAGLQRWAKIVAEHANPPPRTQAPLITGWCSWYNLYAAISEENILAHLRGAAEVNARDQLAMRVFQIDDGFTPEMGDWLDVKPQFPHGIKPVLDAVREAGFIPGLWIAPFLVGNRSRLFAEHPDWVVKAAATGDPLVLMHFYGEFRWHKRSEEYYLLDVTHPEAFEYLRRVFQTWREEWGCGYFKTDFMYYGAHYGPETAVYHQPGLSRVEIWRKAAEMIRETIGDALWMGCGCPLWASVGLVDAVRIGRDVGIQWEGNQSAQSLLRDQATRNFANHILWQADPDSVLLRERFHLLTENEVEALAIYAGMSGGVTTTSDDFLQLSDRRLRLWKLIQPQAKIPCHFPMLGQAAVSYEMESGRQDRLITRSSDPVVLQVRPVSDGHAIFFLNTGEDAVDCDYSLSDLGLPENGYLWQWGKEPTANMTVSNMVVHLDRHAGQLFWYTDHPMSSLPEQLH